MFKLLQMWCPECKQEQEELVQAGEAVTCYCGGAMLPIVATNTVPYNPEVETVMGVRGVKRVNVHESVRHTVRNG